MQDRKEEIIETAAALLQTRSYSSFSYQDLSDELGIRKASIHHHFRTKEDLGVAVAEHYRDGMKARLTEISGLYDQPWDRFEAYLAVVADTMLSGAKICTAGAIQAEHNVVPEAVRAASNAANQYIRGWLGAVLAKGRTEGSMSFTGTPEGQAAMIVAALQGSLQNARAEGPQLYGAVIGQIRASMKPKS